MTRLAVLLLALLFCLGCSRSPEYYLAQGNRFSAEKKYEDAILQYRKALQGNPRLAEAYFQLGRANLESGKTAEAYQSLNRAVELRPDHVEAIRQLGDLSLAAFLSDPRDPRPLYDRVNTLADQLLAKDPKSYDGLRWKGALASLDRKPQEAVKFYTAADQVKPGQEDTLLGLIQARFQVGERAEAEKMALAFLDTHPSFGALYDVLYREYKAQKRLPDAEKILTSKIARNPKNAGYHLQLAEHYARERNAAAMNGVLQKLLDRPADFPNAQLLVGDFHGRLGNIAQATSAYEEGAKSNPKQKSVYQRRTAAALVAQGKADQAIQLLDALVKESPADHEARQQRASLLLARGKAEGVDTALADYQQLVKALPNDAGLRFHLGRAYLAKGNKAAALTELQEAVNRQRAFVPPRILLAQIHLSQKEPQETLRYANEILEIEPTNGAGQLLRTAGLTGAGRLPEARAELERIARLAPDVPEVQLQLGTLAIAEKNYKLAEQIFSRIRQRAPGDNRALAGLVETYTGNHQFDAALQMIGANLKNSPESTAMRQLLAQTAVRAGKYDVAIAEFRKLLEADPKSVELHMRIGDALQLKGELEGAVAEFEKARQLSPAHPAPILFLGTVFQKMGRAAEAKAQYKRLLEMQPDNVLVLNNLAYLLADTGDDLDEALRLAQRARQKEPKHLGLADTLGWVYLKKGMADGAIQVFRNLVREKPEVSTYHYHLAAALLAKGDKTAARQSLETAISKKPAPEEEAKIRELMQKTV